MAVGSFLFLKEQIKDSIINCRSRMSGRQMGRHTVRRTGAGPADDRRCSGSTKRQMGRPRRRLGQGVGWCWRGAEAEAEAESEAQFDAAAEGGWGCG